MESADVEAIRRIAAEHAAGTSQGGAAGAEAYAAGATADARWLPPEAPAIQGREAIKKYVSQFTEMPDFGVTWDHPHVVVAESGEIAYSIGAYKGTGKAPDGATVEHEGKLVNIWHKQEDGSWEIAVAIWNTNEPGAPT